VIAVIAPQGSTVLTENRRWTLAVVFVAICSGLLITSGSGLAQERRVALVIGNSGYQYLPRLTNPASDAQLIASTLKSVGFELIAGKEQVDVNRGSLVHAIREFGAKLASGSVGLFYYAGHGLQVEGVNYLVPVDANVETIADIDFELIDANTILKQMEAANSKLNIMILDACRNNPFGGRDLRDTTAGLAPMRAPRGTLISYATQPGNVAMDGTGRNSPYTTALAEEIPHPGVSLLDVFNEVGLAVDHTTGGKQRPYLSVSPLEGRFYFRGAPPPVNAKLEPQPAPRVPEPVSSPIVSPPDASTRLVVDVQALLQNSAAGRAVRQQIEAKRAEYTKEISGQEEALRRERDALQRQQASLSPESLNQKGRDFQQKVNDLERNVQGKRQALEKSNGDALQKIQEQMLKIIADIAKQRKANLVFQRTDLVLFDQTFDVTDEVLKKLDEQMPTLMVDFVTPVPQSASASPLDLAAPSGPAAPTSKPKKK
jgi:Skp family chaperone for outer membrane proteins